MTDKEQIENLQGQIEEAKFEAALEHLDRINKEIEEYMKKNPQVESIEEMKENN